MTYGLPGGWQTQEAEALALLRSDVGGPLFPAQRKKRKKVEFKLKDQFYEIEIEAVQTKETAAPKFDIKAVNEAKKKQQEQEDEDIFLLMAMFDD